MSESPPPFDLPGTATAVDSSLAAGQPWAPSASTSQLPPAPALDNIGNEPSANVADVDDLMETASVSSAEEMKRAMEMSTGDPQLRPDPESLPPYRSPEAIQECSAPATPSAVIEEVLMPSANAAAFSPSNWSIKAENDASERIPPLEMDESDALAQPLGHGLLPTALFEPPYWPLQGQGWEVAIAEVPAFTPPPAPPSDTSTQPTPSPSPSPLPVGTAVAIPRPAWTTLPPLSEPPASAPRASTSALPSPPTVDEVRASLPQIPAGMRGSVLFDTSAWCWWIVLGGDDGSPPADLVSAGTIARVTGIATQLKSWRDRVGTPAGEEIRCPWWIPMETLEGAGEEPVVLPRVTLDPPPLDELPTKSLAEGVLVDVEPMDTTPVDAVPPAPELVATVGRPDRLFISANDLRWVILPGQPAVKGVFDPDLLREFVKTRVENPAPNVKHGAEAALTIILTMITNTLFQNDPRAIKVDNKNFASKVGWDPLSEKLFSRLGYVIHDPVEPGESVLIVPPKEPAAWLQTRARLMRAWVELSVFLDEYRYERHHLPPDTPPKHRGLVCRSPPFDTDYAAVCGALQSQIPRVTLAGFQSYDFTAGLQTLGLNRDRFYVPASHIGFAYRMQARFNAPLVSTYLQALSDVTNEWTGSGKEDLQILLVSEESKGVHTQKAIDQAFEGIPGLDKKYQEDILMLDGPHQIPESWIQKCFGEAFQDLSKHHPEGSQELADAKARLIGHLDVIASSRRHDPVQFALLSEVVSQARREPMNPKEAYRVLEAGEDTTEDMLQVLFEIRLTDNASQAEKFKDALRAIADLRNSKALRALADTGVRDAPPVEDPQPVSADIPVGLNNIGNTCYLNSLLQYFYTLSDVRSIVSDAARYKEDLALLPLKAEKRVGGRAITRKEVERSIRFIDLLGNLFTSLEFSDTASVEPEHELAYLSLVTPQDEAAEQVEPSAAPKDDGRTSQDTDITLVEEPLTLPQSPPPLRPRLLSLSSSVLGKRSSEDRDEAMQVDHPISPSAYRNLSAFRDSTMSEERSDVTTEPSPPPTSPPSASSITKSPRHDNQESIRRATREMTIGPEEGLLDRDPSEVGPEIPDVPQVPLETPRLVPPPLPPRKSSQKPFMSEGGSGAMMFGRQHDVSECMDNVLFQIDAALDTDKLQEGSGQSESLVKNLFFGQARQAITLDGETKPNPDHEQEVLFNHLLLNVGDTGTSKDLHDTLADYYTPEPVEIAGKPATMKEVPVKYPALLHLQLQRAQFDRQTGRAYKSNAFVDLPQEISLDRYLCPSDDEKAIQSATLNAQMRQLRERINVLEQPRGTRATASLTFLLDEVFNSDADWLPSNSIDEELLTDMAAQKVAVMDEIVQAETKIKELKAEVEDLWKDDRQTQYLLTSVFMHRGDTGFGHYWLYQRNVPSHPEEWFKYNDSTVTKVQPEDVLSDTKSNATAYLAVYQRADRPGLVDTVHRTLF